jgi:hypothetical protein
MKKFTALFIAIITVICLTGGAKVKSGKERLAGLATLVRTELDECKHDLELVNGEIAKFPEGRDDLVSRGMYSRRSIDLDCIEKKESVLARIDRVLKDEAVTFGFPIILGPVVDGIEVPFECDYCTPEQERIIRSVTVNSDENSMLCGNYPVGFKPAMCEFASLVGGKDVSALNECYAGELLKNPMLSVFVSLKLVIQPDGKVGHNELQTGTLDDPDTEPDILTGDDNNVEQCALRVLSSIQYPARDKLSVVKLKLKFE